MDVGDQLYFGEPEIGEGETKDVVTCRESEMESLFDYPYECKSEVQVSSPKTSILHLSGNICGKPLCAAALSDFTCSVYDVESLHQVCSLKAHTEMVSGVKFSSLNENLLYSGSSDGCIKLWDLRAGTSSVKEYKGDEGVSEEVKPIISFDVTPNDRFICAGTSVLSEGAFILFWDVRTTRLLGGYWESHNDDITQVKCHPSKDETIATGSTDGLINIFDIRKPCEEDAILYCLNTESSVERIGWFSHGGKDGMSCITHTQDLQLWDTLDASPYARFSRESITLGMMDKCTEDCYLVDVYERKRDNKLILLCGSAAGQSDCLRLLNVQTKKVSPMSVLQGNKQIVRASWFSQENESFITAGESGTLNVWKPNLFCSESGHMKPTMGPKVKLRQHRVNPY